MDYRFQWCDSLSAPDFPVQAYAQLCERLSHSTPFNHLTWLLAAEHNLEPDQPLHVLLAWKGDQLSLCLPLVAFRESRFGLRWRTLRHLGYPMSDRLALLCQLDDSGLTQALEEIRRRLPHTLLQLNELTTDANTQRCMQHWAHLSSSHHCHLSCRAPYHLISPQDRQEPHRNVRYKLRKARKRSDEIGATVRRVAPDAASIGALLDSLAAVEERSWKGQEEVGIFCEPRRGWMREAFTALAAVDLVRVVMLEHEGRCISYRLGLLHNGRLYDYNLAFLPEYAELSGGRLLLDEWIQWGLEEGWRWVDASRISRSGSTHQLHERMNGQVEHLRWSFYSWRPSGILMGLAHRAWEWRKQRRSGEPLGGDLLQGAGQ
ncbi:MULTISPECIES: GNAT family N-acetyltransferase [Pseudomonas]|uniref:GNAT family N-acetyltransferase n=1 Tax=Pseudomonas TaxID=286 RepID=UPI000690C676|nr:MULTISPECIES: GNAT family N-acetyltransferase [Pseudomonas]SCY21832.1 Acetyltransferase involved in cellulose biosynthesis, CelD/BcsL family [Pseudomonas flexibilis]